MAGAAGTVSADAYAVMIERVQPGDAEEFILKVNPFVTRYIPVDKGIKVAARNFRYPFQLAIGGNFQVTNRDGGEIPKGTGSLFNSCQAAVKEFALVGKLTSRVKDQTDTTEVAVQKMYQDQFVKQMKQSADYEDILWHGDGTAAYTGGAASVTTWATGTKTVYTFNKAVDQIGLNRLLEGMSVSVFASDGTTQKTASGQPMLLIEQINRTTGEVFLNGLINSTSPAAGDFLGVRGVTALSSFNNYAGTPALSPDSSVHGMYYFNDSNGANYLDGQLKSSIPQLLATSIDGTGTTYNSLLVMSMRDKADERFGDKISDGWIAVAPKAQRYSLAEEQIQAVVVNNETVQAKYDDVISKDMEGPRPQYSISGVPHYTSFRQYRDRVDFLDPRLFRKVTNISGVQPLKVNDKPVWNSLGTNNYEFAYESGWEFVFNWYSRHPGAGAFINNLEISSTYRG